MKRFSLLLAIVMVVMTGCIIVPAGGHRGYYDHGYYDRGYYDRGHYDGYGYGGYYRR